MDAAAKAAARELWHQHRERATLRALAPSHAPRDIASAYRAQDAYLELVTAETGQPIVGWKIALTTPVMQAFVGIPHPLAGAIFAESVHSSPASLRCSAWVRVGLEAEIAVRIGAALSPAGAPYDRDTAAAHVAACAAALEIVDDRGCDYDGLDPHLLIADNAFNAGCVLGPEQRDWTALDLARAPGAMHINGAEVGSGVGGDALGHPFAALAWLANHLIERGRCLEAGHVVLTGSIVTTKWPRPGDAVTAEVAGLGAAAAQMIG